MRCGEEFCQRRLVFDRSSLTRWRQRMGEDKLLALLQESLAVAARTTYLGRVIRDIGRGIAGNDALQEFFARALSLARRVRDQNHRQRRPEVYSLHAPEVECIGKGKAHRPYEFGVKVRW